MDQLQLRRYAAKRLDEIPFTKGLLEDLIEDSAVAENDRQTFKRDYAKLSEEQRQWRVLLGLDD